MATKKFTKKMKCVNVSMNMNRANVSFAEDMQETEKGAVAKNVVSVALTDIKDAAAFTPGKVYSIEISE